MANKHASARTVTIVIVALCALFAAGAYSLGVMNMKAEVPDEKETAAEIPSASPAIEGGLLSVKEDELVIGRNDAPVTIVEYASLSCSHCAHFHSKELPELEKTIIESGKARLVLRQFPLNPPALKAAQLVQCVPLQERRKFIKVLFDMQADWAYTESYLDKLKQIAAVGGISNEKFDACVNDEASEEAILQQAQTASDRLQINGTPAFFINDNVYTGAFNAKDLKEAVEAVLAK